ncbi:conserved hypothetical protein [Candidatus Defluviicoccus seviourii]|uniref:RloB-like protein n=2 Tax=root TaxID=1 RepID=A0A564WEY0_9PROT|nr:conserved hypothetical protein [Candidatus Defluviicoccus seviourii]
MPPNLRRRHATREPKRRFIIYCEGRNTEPAYFRALQRHCSSVLIEIEPVGVGGEPFTVAGKAVERAQELGLIPNDCARATDSFEEKDEVWAVFDRDVHEKFHNAVQKCQSNRVRVGRSNPCFELWLILHHEDYDKSDGRHAVQTRCQQVCTGYDKDRAKTPCCANLMAHVDAAIKRAEGQLARRKNDGEEFGCPSTTVGRLVQAILEAAKKSGRN